MLCNGTLHEQQSDPLSDGTHRAITMINAPPHGVLVWAGHLSPSALEKSAREIEASDYVVRQTISFMAWEHIWAYFAGSAYEALAQRQRQTVEEIYFSNID